MDQSKRKITKIAREVNKFTVRTLRQEGIGTSEFDVIHIIRKNPGITQTEICKLLGMDKGDVARKIANLEQKGYLERKQNPKDGRSRILFATQKAECLKKSKVHIETIFYEYLMDALSEAERDEFERLLDILYVKCKSESKAGFATMTAKMEREEIHEKK